MKKSFKLIILGFIGGLATVTNLSAMDCFKSCCGVAVGHQECRRLRKGDFNWLVIKKNGVYITDDDVTEILGKLYKAREIAPFELEALVRACPDLREGGGRKTKKSDRFENFRYLSFFEDESIMCRLGDCEILITLGLIEADTKQPAKEIVELLDVAVVINSTLDAREPNIYIRSDADLYGHCLKEQCLITKVDYYKQLHEIGNQEKKIFKSSQAE